MIAIRSSDRFLGFCRVHRAAFANWMSISWLQLAEQRQSPVARTATDKTFLIAPPM
jgi:hypothetical protein